MADRQGVGIYKGERTTPSQITNIEDYRETTTQMANIITTNNTKANQLDREGIADETRRAENYGNSLTQNSPEVPKRNKPLGETLPQRQDSNNTEKPARTSLFMKPMSLVGAAAPESSHAKRDSHIPPGHLANLKKMRSKEFSESNLQSQFRTSNLRLDSEISVQSSPFHKATESESTISRAVQQTQRPPQINNSKTIQGYESQPQTKRQDSTDFRYKNSETPSIRGSSGGQNTIKRGNRSPLSQPKHKSPQGIRPDISQPRFMQPTAATASKDNRELALKHKHKNSRVMRQSKTEGNMDVLNRNLRQTGTESEQIKNPTIVYEESQKSSTFSNLSKHDNDDISEVIPVYLRGDLDVDFGDQMEKDINRLRSPQGVPSNSARRSTLRKLQNQKFQVKENATEDSKSRGSMMEGSSYNFAKHVARESISGSAINIGIQRGHPQIYVEPEKIESSKINDGIEIQRISRKIRKVIRTVGRDLDELTSEQIQQCLMALGYLPFIANQSSYEFADHASGTTQNRYQDEIDRAGSLFLTFVFYINPLDKPKVPQSIFVEFLSLIMMNITSLSEAKLVEIITEYVMTQLRALGINLMSETIPEEQESTLINAIPEEDDTKAKRIFNEFAGAEKTPTRGGVTNQTRNGIDVREYYGLEEVQIVNKFMGRYQHTLTVARFVKGFKHDHAERFAFKQVRKAKRVRLLSPQIAATVSKRAADIIPQNQNRILKDSTVRAALEPYTFSPKINKTTQSMAKSRQVRRLNEMTESRTQAALVSQVARTGTLAPEQKYYVAQYETQMREQKLQKLKMELDLKKQEEEDCTFSPRLNKKAFAHVQSRVGQSLNGTELQSLANYEATTYKFAKNQRAEKEAEQEAECTFRPYFAAARSFRSKSSFRVGPKSKCLFDTVITDKGEQMMPKGFAKYVNRQRNKQVEKEQLDEKLQRETSGNRYQRAKLQNVQPPSFIIKPNNTEKSKRKDVLVSLDIKITPTRTGKLCIKKGDDVETVAKNFCMAYQLKAEMQEQLAKQLQIHIQCYHEQQEASESLKALVASPESINKSKATRREQMERMNKLTKKTEAPTRLGARMMSPETAPRPAFSSPARTPKVAVTIKATSRFPQEIQPQKVKAAPKRLKASVEYEQKLQQIRDMQKMLRGEQSKTELVVRRQEEVGPLYNDIRQESTKQSRKAGPVAPLNLELVVAQPQISDAREQRLAKMFERLNTSNSNATERSNRDIVTSQSTSKITTKQAASSKTYSTQTISKTIITRTWVPGTMEEVETEPIEQGEDEDPVPEDEGTPEQKGARRVSRGRNKAANAKDTSFKNSTTHEVSHNNVSDL